MQQSFCCRFCVDFNYNNYIVYVKCFVKFSELKLISHSTTEDVAVKPVSHSSIRYNI